MLDFEKLIIAHKNSMGSILPFSLKAEDCYPLDLSIDNKELQQTGTLTTDLLTDYIENKLLASQKRVAIGGYAENRVVYKMSGHFGSGEQARSVHLGIDIWCSAETPVSAPLDSLIHSFQDNKHFGDYGPTIILEHALDGQKFYTLYGHLSRTSLKNIRPGDFIKSGSVFASIGNAHENGNWPPHLHFQVILDMMGKTGDFPGVCTVTEQEKWFAICPDPRPVLGL